MAKWIHSLVIRIPVFSSSTIFPRESCLYFIQNIQILRLREYPVFSKAPLFSVNVIFKDEPDNVYYKKDKGQVVQYSHASFKSDTNNKYKYVEK
jgi:hypothetical protein